MRLLPLLALLLAAPISAQTELRASVQIVIRDPTSLFGVDLTVTNSSTAPRAITSIRTTLEPSTMLIDTFGTPSVSVSESPTVGANNDSQNANAVTLTLSSPLMPGQTFTALNGDYDPNALTGIRVALTFDDGTVLEQPLVQSPAATWSAQYLQASVPLYPVTLSWQPPTENTDGTPLTDLAGFKIYWGAQQGTYANSKTVADPAAVMDDVAVPAGSWYFVATAFNTAGNESEYSNVASGVASPEPNAPTGLEQLEVDQEASGLAFLVFTVRNQILFVEAGTARTGAACDPDQMVRGILPTDQMPHTLHLVAVEDVTLLPAVLDGELALFAECSAP